MSYLLKKHLSLSILLLLLIYKPVKSDVLNIIQFSAPFIGGTLYDNYNNSKSYTERYGQYSKYFAPLDHIEVGRLHHLDLNLKYYSITKIKVGRSITGPLHPPTTWRCQSVCSSVTMTTPRARPTASMDSPLAQRSLT